MQELPQLKCAVGPASGDRFVEAAGRRCALLGNELGVFELWIWPLKVAHELELSFRFDGRRVRGRDAVTSIDVRPDRLVLHCECGPLRARTTIAAAREHRAALFLVEVETDRDVELELGFMPDFRPQWPAGMGGQIARRDPETGTFLLTEERGRFAAALGSPEAVPTEAAGDHALPRDPVRIRVPVSAARAGRGPVPILIAGAEVDPEPLSEEARLGGGAAAEGLARTARVITAVRAAYRALARDWPALLEENERHWRGFLAGTAELETPDAETDEAFLWAKVAIERAWVEVDGVGSGPLAGLGPSGSGERPGFGWIFDGDALVASRAMTAYGDFAGARRVFEAAASRQRADGKLMHELVLSAGLCDWLGDYPYAYYKGGNTPGFIACLDHHWRGSGDAELARRLAPAVERAFRFCEKCLEDGLLSNERAGLAAVEAGPLVGRLRSEVFLSGIWLSALSGLRSLREALGDPRLARDAAAREAVARAAFEGFWSQECGRYGFARLTDGTLQEDLTAYLAHPLSRGHGQPGRALASARQLDRPELAADWGPRWFAEDSEDYEPDDYNTGSVFPYATNFSVLALYRHGLVTAARRQLAALVQLTGFSGAGFVPEHLRGDRAEAPARGVPHQIFSSAAVVQSLVYGLFGLAPAASERALVWTPALPPDWDRAALSGFRVGASVVDLELRRERAEGRTRLAGRVELRAGPPLQVFFRPSLPPLSRGVTWSAGGEAGAAPCELDGVALRPRVPGVDVEGSMEIAVEGELGPELAPPAFPLKQGEMSAAARVPDVRVDADGESVTWTIWGRRGRSARIPWRSDRPVRVAGAARVEGGALELEFGGEDDGSFASREVSAAPVPAESEVR